MEDQPRYSYKINVPEALARKLAICNPVTDRMFFKIDESLNGDECRLDSNYIFVSPEKYTELENEFGVDVLKAGVKQYFEKNPEAVPTSFKVNISFQGPDNLHSLTGI